MTRSGGPPPCSARAPRNLDSKPGGLITFVKCAVRARVPEAQRAHCSVRSVVELGEGSWRITWRSSRVSPSTIDGMDVEDGGARFAGAPRPSMRWTSRTARRPTMAAMTRTGAPTSMRWCAALLLPACMRMALSTSVAGPTWSDPSVVIAPRPSSSAVTVAARAPPPSRLPPLKVPVSLTVAPLPPAAAEASADAAGATSTGRAGTSEANAAAPKRTRPRIE